LRIVVVDQITHGEIPIVQLPGHLAGLLGDPGRIGMGGTTGQIDPSRSMFDEKEDIKRQKIAGQKLLFVVIEKRAPGTTRP
jgi:hypothetical protein